jgi:hypothetical protein
MRRYCSRGSCSGNPAAGGQVVGIGVVDLVAADASDIGNEDHCRRDARPIRPGLVCLSRIRTRATTTDVSAASPNLATLGCPVGCSSSHGALWCTGRTACWPRGIGTNSRRPLYDAQHDRHARPQAPDGTVNLGRLAGLRGRAGMGSRVG